MHSPSRVHCIEQTTALHSSAAAAAAVCALERFLDVVGREGAEY